MTPAPAAPVGSLLGSIGQRLAAKTELHVEAKRGGIIMVRFLTRDLGQRPVGVWIALAAIAYLLLIGGGGQILSLVDWQLAMRLGLQEDSFGSDDVAERVAAHFEWGVAASDTFVVVPLMMIGLLGIILRRRWGLVAAMMAALIMGYMVVTFGLQRYSLALRGDLRPWEHYAPTVGLFALAAGVPCALIVAGLAANADRFAQQRPNSHMLRRRGEMMPGGLETLLIWAWQSLQALFEVLVCGRTTWNVSPEEVERTLAGDQLVPSGRAVNRAITVDQPVDQVWPWLAQLGRGAGYYSWDFLDNPSHRHADYLIDTPPLVLGDWSKDLGTVEHLEAGREIVWLDEVRFFGCTMRVAMDFRLDPIDERSTRVQFRMTAELPDTLHGRIAFKVGNLIDHVMSTEMLRRVKLLVETYSERSRNAETNRDTAPHQRSEWRPARDD